MLRKNIREQLRRIKSQNSRGAGLFDIKVEERDGRATIAWTKKDSWRDWASLSEGCYLLRTNVMEWSAEDLWRAYIQLTEAEAAFRIEIHVPPKASIIFLSSSFSSVG